MSNAKSTTVVDLRKAGNVATVRFVTEGGVSIFSSRVMGELGNIIDEIAKDSHVRFVVFRGDGKTFVAGADISEMSHFREEDGLAFARKGHHVFDAIEAMPQVTFAAINGHCVGGGCELSLACDFRIAVAAAKLGQSESKLGLIPGWGGTKRLPKLVGLGKARRLMFSGELISAEQALQIGLVDEIVATPEALDECLKKWMKELSTGAPAAINRIKQALLNRDEMEQFALSFSCEEAKEGIAAFIEKKHASWMPK